MKWKIMIVLSILGLVGTNLGGSFGSFNFQNIASQVEQEIRQAEINKAKEDQALLNDPDLTQPRDDFYGNNSVNPSLVRAVKIKDSKVNDLLRIMSQNIPGFWINLQDSDGSTAIINAVKMSKQNIIDALIAAQSFAGQLQYFISDKDGNTALIHAAINNDLATVNKLLNKAGSALAPNAQNNAGDTALMIAVKHGNKDIIHAILDFPNLTPSKHITNKQGKTAWDLATDEIKRAIPKLDPAGKGLPAPATPTPTPTPAPTPAPKTVPTTPRSPRTPPPISQPKESSTSTQIGGAMG